MVIKKAHQIKSAFVHNVLTWTEILQKREKMQSNPKSNLKGYFKNMFFQINNYIQKHFFWIQEITKDKQDDAFNAGFFSTAWLTLVVGDSPVHCGMFVRIFGLYPLDASSIPRPGVVTNNQTSSDTAKWSFGRVLMVDNYYFNAIFQLKKIKTNQLP